MLKISNISLPVGHSSDALRKKTASLLNVKPSAFDDFTILRQSIDARKKNDVRWMYTVAVSLSDEEHVAQRSKVAVPYTPAVYALPNCRRGFSHPPVVVGMGPAGLFAALALARAGVPPIILERGQPIEERSRHVAQFWSGASLLPESNVQFGEGGAGTFSDGKLTTGVNDPRISFVFDTFVSHGAPSDIKYSHKPHVGTDVLRSVITSMRKELLSLGCDIRFGHRLESLEIKDNHLRGLSVVHNNACYSLPCESLILAPGHSARDTFAMLHEIGVPLTQKPFAIGVRIEHKQADLSLSQYGPVWESLPPSDYKLACHLPNGRSAFTFCVCPGGQVVAAASEPGRLVTNGMSHRARDGENINGGFLVGVTPSDFGSSHPLAGVNFQIQWEEAAFKLGGGNFHAPVQTVGDFLAGHASSQLKSVSPTYLPGVTPTDLHHCLPAFVTETLSGALPQFERKLHGFSDPNALLTGVETRSSSPVRIIRDEGFQSPLRGLFPCGEGAGYAGGIVSAAVDGIKVAEALLAP